MTRGPSSRSAFPFGTCTNLRLNFQPVPFVSPELAMAVEQGPRLAGEGRGRPSDDRNSDRSEEPGKTRVHYYTIRHVVCEAELSRPKWRESPASDGSISGGCREAASVRCDPWDGRPRSRKIRHVHTEGSSGKRWMGTGKVETRARRPRHVTRMDRMRRRDVPVPPSGELQYYGMVGECHNGPQWCHCTGSPTVSPKGGYEKVFPSRKEGMEVHKKGVVGKMALPEKVVVVVSRKEHCDHMEGVRMKAIRALNILVLLTIMEHSKTLLLVLE